jgi:hypothetical protein
MPIDDDLASVKQRTLDRLWDMHYGEAPPKPGNLLGFAIRAARGWFPRLGREEFDREFGESFDDGIAAMKAALPKLHDELAEQMKTSKILCLADAPDNVLMWAHYADGHRGICLELQSVPELDSVWGAARPVDYLEQLPLLYDADLVSRVMSGEATLDGRAMLDRMVYTKSVHWAYEHEWRVFGGDGREKHAPYEDGLFSHAELSAVILGSEMPAEAVDEFRQLVAERFPGATLRRAIKNQAAFALDIVDS